MIPLGYFLLSLLMSVVLFWLGNALLLRSGKPRTLIRRNQLRLLLALAGWHLYIYAIAASGILLDYSFPPRFVLFLVLPAFAFTALFAYRNRNASWLQQAPAKWGMYYQSFRIGIELLFYFSVAQGLLHKQVTIEGYNYDMLYALTALPLGYLIFKKKVLPQRFALAWHYLGLMVIASIIFLFLTTTYFPYWYGSTTSLLPPNFGAYPYVLIPGFLMPSAVFVHVLSIVQLSRKPLTKPVSLSPS